MARAIPISQATLADAPLLSALHAASFGGGERPWGEREMAQFIANPGTLCLIGFLESMEPQPSGLLIARQAADEAELLTIGVVPEARRRGVGRALLQHAVASLRTGGVQRLFLEVDETNMPAVALYRAFGGALVGNRAQYYDNGADAAIFSLALSVPHSDDARSAHESREDQR